MRCDPILGWMWLIKASGLGVGADKDNPTLYASQAVTEVREGLRLSHCDLLTKQH